MMTTTKERPILFKPEMVRATRADWKTQTRRTKGLAAINEAPHEWNLDGLIINSGDKQDIGKWAFFDDEGGEILNIRCPYGLVGDRLWVKEMFYVQESLWEKNRGPQPIHYACETDPDTVEDYIKKPSIYMPRWACRLVLEITDVRVERVQDISEQDAIAEGILAVEPGEVFFEFIKLWNSVHPKDGLHWDANPWVWVITFKKAATHEGPASLSP